MQATLQERAAPFGSAAGRMWHSIGTRKPDNLAIREVQDILNWMDDPEHETGQNFFARVHPDDREVYTAAEAGLTPEHPFYQTSFRCCIPTVV
jgi:hypothetical protein